MKRLLAIIVCLIPFAASYAQRTTYQDLKYVLYHNVEQSHDYLVKKGFKSKSIDTAFKNDNSEAVLYFYKNTTPKSTIEFHKERFDNKFYGASVNMLSEENYLELKRSIIISGFKFQHAETRDNRVLNRNVRAVYSKNNFFIYFYVSKRDKSNFYNYFISLEDISLIKVKVSLGMHEN